MHNFLSNLAYKLTNPETDKSKNLTSLGEGNYKLEIAAQGIAQCKVSATRV